MAKDAIFFIDYDKISDTIMALDNEHTLRFNVRLSYKDKSGFRKSFHSETEYYSNNFKNREVGFSIRRSLTFYFSIDDIKNYENSVMIKTDDVFFLKNTMENKILPWFMGDKRIYSVKNKKLVITGKWAPQQVNLSDFAFLAFMPIVIEYENGQTDYGVRMCISDLNNFADLSLSKFVSFYHIIANTDMYCAASNLLNYVKQGPYGVNLFNMTDKR